MKFSIEYNFDIKLVDKLVVFCKENNLSTNNFEFFTSNPNYYGTLPRNNPLGELSFFDHINYIKKFKFNIVYALNLPVLDINLLATIIDDLLNIGISEFSVADFKGIKFLSDKYGKIIKINISTGVRIYELSKIKGIIENTSNINKLILSHSINGNILRLSQIISFANTKNVNIELVGNEAVVYDNYLDSDGCLAYKKIMNIGFSGKGCCSFFYNVKNLSLNREISIIRPEDTIYYKKIGLSSIKISIRKGISTNKIFSIINSYFYGQYKGNLFYFMGDQGVGKNLSGYIKNDIIKSYIHRGKIKLNIGNNLERLNFIKYFLNNKYYKGNYKSYFEFKLEEYTLYSGYCTSIFKSEIKFNNILRNNIVLNFLRNKINYNLYEKIKEIFNFLNIKGYPIHIAFGGFDNYYRIYFKASKNILELLGFDEIAINPYDLMAINLNGDDIDTIKYYQYINENNIEYTNLFEKFSDLGKVEFIFKMKEYSTSKKLMLRTKYYFKFKKLKYSNQKSLERFNYSLEDLSLDDVYINFIAIDKGTGKQQLYITDLENNLIM